MHVVAQCLVRVISHLIDFSQRAAIGLRCLMSLVLTLAGPGVFGVLARSVQQRVREFGVRIGLGATTTNVLAMVFGRTARMLGVGIVVGLVAAATVGRSMVGVPVWRSAGGSAHVWRRRDAARADGACASAIPAFRTARVDPMVALRQD